jgi:hypothetical protein
MTEYKIYTFEGYKIYSKDCKNKILHKMTLKQYFEKYFKSSFDVFGYALGLDRLYATSDCVFTENKMTVQEIFNRINSGAVIFPFSEKCKKHEVIQYLNHDFEPLFMKTREFKRMLKEYQDYC